MDLRKLTKGLAKIAVSTAVSYGQRIVEAKERLGYKESFRKTAKDVVTKQDVLGLQVGDAICVGNEFMGVVVDKNDNDVCAIPAFRQSVVKNWYTSYLVLPFNLRRTDSSHMNSVGNFIYSDATSYDDGMWNLMRIKAYMEKRKDDKHVRIEFPVFEYCMQLGENYYLPALGELLRLQSENRLTTINDVLKSFYADAIIPNNDDCLYWSSTDDVDHLFEYNNYANDSGAYAVRIDASGTVRKDVISKRDAARILPFYKIQL